MRSSIMSSRSSSLRFSGLMIRVRLLEVVEIVRCWTICKNFCLARPPCGAFWYSSHMT